MSFAEFVQWYQLGRSEGLVLRYLSDAYRAIRQTVPVEARTDELEDIIAWLGELVRQTDSSLVDEWEALAAGVDAPEGPEALPPAPPSLVANRRAFTVLVRNEMFRRVQLAALERDDELQALDQGIDWPAVLDAYYAEHDELLAGGPARSPALCRIDDADPGVWHVEQTLDDPAGDRDWRHPGRRRPGGQRRRGRRGAHGHLGRPPLMETTRSGATKCSEAAFLEHFLAPERVVRRQRAETERVASTRAVLTRARRALTWRRTARTGSPTA